MIFILSGVSTGSGLRTLVTAGALVEYCCFNIYISSAWYFTLFTITAPESKSSPYADIRRLVFIYQLVAAFTETHIHVYLNCCDWINSGAPVGHHLTHVCELDSHTSVVFHWNGEKCWRCSFELLTIHPHLHLPIPHLSSPQPSAASFLPLFRQLFLHSVSLHPIWMHRQCAVWSPFLEEMSRAVLWRKVTSVRGGCSADEKVAVCGWGGVESVCWFQGYCPRPFEAAGNSWGWVREEVRRVDGGGDTASADMKLCG